MYNKPSQRAFQSLVTPASLPQKPLQIRSPDNSQNNSRRPSHLNSSPSKDPENALNFYLSLPKKASSISVSKTARNVGAQENIDYENDNFTTEPVQHTQGDTYSPPKVSKWANRSIGQGAIAFQNSKNKDQKGKSRGIDSVSQVNKESAYSTAVISSPKISPYNSVNTAQTHLIVKTPNVNRNLENQINQTVGSYLDNQNQDEETYWEVLEKKSISPMQSVITNKQYQSEIFPWDQEDAKTSQRTPKEKTSELFSSPRTVGAYETGSPQTSYQSSRRTSKPETYQQETGPQSVRSNIETRRSDKPFTFEGEPKEQVRSPGQVRKTKKYAEQRGQSGTWKDSVEDLGISKRSNYSDKEKARLMEELMNLQKELEEKNMEAQELQDEERRQERENQRMMEEINEIENARKENEEVIKKLKERSKVQVKEISTLKKFKEELERHLKEFGGKAKEFKDCSNRVKKCREEVDKTNKQILQLNKRLERINQEESEAIEEERRRTEQELRRLEAEVASRDEEIRELEKELIDVNEKKEEYKLVAEKIRELEELQRELMEENDNLRERLESFFKDQTNSYKQAQDSELNVQSLQEKEHKDMEEVSVNLLKVRKRLEEIETYSKKIMKILEFSKQGKEIPIELILPHNRGSRADRKNSNDGLFVKKMNKNELKNAVIENIRLADDTRRRLEQNVVNMLEGYLRKNRENDYY